MRVHAERVAVDGPHGPLLRPTSVRVAAGRVAVLAGEPDDGHAALGLALTGRLRPASGLVTLDGDEDPAGLRAISALVDSPEVTAPDDALRLTDVVAEGLALAGRPRRGAAVADWLAARDLTALAGTRVDAVPPAARTLVLTDLATTRDEVRLLVLDRPDRHTGDPQAYWPLAVRTARAGLAVLLLCHNASARLLPVTADLLGTAGSPSSGVSR